ncbi:hypothetical protein C8R44DRAFT_903693, partial [Mycena epipterygia]
QVPLDYSVASLGTAALAVIRLPADASNAEYRGPLLFNPGGPGSSGVDTLVLLGPSLQRVFGNQYEIVSFDPRDVSNSTPVSSFFETDAERALWNASAIPSSLNASSDAIPHSWARANILGQLAAQRDISGILKYMTTDNVAGDMLLITQKFGFEKLQYYGLIILGYGSILGTTFDALLPNKVERILIDGTADYSANLTIEATDTNKVLQSFFEGCTAAGPELCAFYEPTAAAIADRLSALTVPIRAHPVPVVTPTAYGIVDYSFLRSTLFSSCYFPYSLFVPLAQALAALERGDGTFLFSVLTAAPDQLKDSGEVLVAIECGDAVEVTDSIEELRAFVDAAAAQTSGFVDASASSCINLRRAESQLFLLRALKTLAGFPGSALFTQDSPGCVSPLLHVILRQHPANERPQHTSVTAPSLCTAAYFRQYFQNGTLPALGTVCPVEAAFFPAPTNSTASRPSALSVENEGLLEALKIIGDSVRPIIMRRKLGN